MENQATIPGTKVGNRSANRLVKTGSLFMITFLLLIFLLPWFWRQAVRIYYSNHIRPIETIEPSRVAIVFGAAVYSDGRLSSVLRDRMDRMRSP